MEKIETLIGNNYEKKQKEITQDDIVEKINEIVEWINSHKDQLLN
ncbi:MAG: hypothetical protein WC933_02800 [Candidatus Paceibacterota bacterium]|jgi:hypothetical protein